MTLSEAQGLLSRFRRTPWRFQQTFHTPLNSLPAFVSAVVSAHGVVQGATVTIEQVVFEPKNLNALLAKHSLVCVDFQRWSVTADGEREVAELLKATLGDWLDFLFVPTPKPFAIYADHDEYTTFLANTKSHLNRVVHALSAGGFKEVKDYEREL